MPSEKERKLERVFPFLANENCLNGESGRDCSHPDNEAGSCNANACPVLGDIYDAIAYD